MKVLFIIWFSFFIRLGLYGQTLPFTVTPTTKSQDILLLDFDSISYNGGSVVLGDAIGVFYKQDQTLTCAGYLLLDGFTRKFRVYGNDAVDNGFMNGELMEFKYWHKATNCLVSEVDFFLTDRYYSTKGTDTITRIAARPAVVKFESNFFCKRDTAVLPVTLQVENSARSNVDVFVNPPLQGYDGIAKQITDFSNAEGMYDFSFVLLDGSCVAKASSRIHITATLNNAPDVNVVSPTCENPTGSIFVDTSTLDKGRVPFMIKIKAESSGLEYVSQSGMFEKIPSDDYKLIIQDQRSCADTFMLKVDEIANDCEQLRDIITPDSFNEYSELYLPWKGETKIYNSQWQLVHILSTPTVWNGKDVHGKNLSTGLYFIFTNDKKVKEVTLIESYRGN